MAITFAELSAILGQLWWPFFRIGAVFISMPFFRRLADPGLGAQPACPVDCGDHRALNARHAGGRLVLSHVAVFGL